MIYKDNSVQSAWEAVQEWIYGNTGILYNFVTITIATAQHIENTSSFRLDTASEMLPPKQASSLMMKSLRLSLFGAIPTYITTDEAKSLDKIPEDMVLLSDKSGISVLSCSFLFMKYDNTEDAIVRQFRFRNGHIFEIL